METFNFMINETSKGDLILRLRSGEKLFVLPFVFFSWAAGGQNSQTHGLKLSIVQWGCIYRCAEELETLCCKIMYLRKQELKVGIQWGTISR